MKKYYIMFSLLCLSACSEMDTTQPFDHRQAALLLKEQHHLHPTLQTIKLPLTDASAWNRIDLSYGTVGTPIMLVPRNETEHDWTESFRTQIRGYQWHPDMTADTLVQEMFSDAKQTCATVHTKILHENEVSTEYRVMLTGCKEQADQVQYGKVFNGSDAVYAVYYTALIDKVDDKQRSKQAETIHHAKLIFTRQRGR